jgi:amino acid permease
LPYVALPNPLRKKNGHGGSSKPQEALMNVVVNLLGMGLLTAPHAYSKGGLFTGFGIMVATAMASRYTLLRLVQMTESTLQEGSPSYPELANQILGRQGMIMVRVAFLMYTVGLLSGYLVIFIDLSRLLCSPLIQVPRLFMTVLAILCCAPGGMMKSLRYRHWISGGVTIGILGMVLGLTASCLDKFMGPFDENAPVENDFRPDDVDYIRDDFQDVSACISLFAVLFSLHGGGIELLSKSSVPDRSLNEGLTVLSGDEQSDMPAAESVSKRGFVIALVFVSIIGMCSYLHWGDLVNGNVFTSFREQRFPLLLGPTAFIYMLTIPVSFAHLMVPCRFAVMDVFALRRSNQDAIGSPVSDKTFAKASISVIVFVGVVALLVNDLGWLMELVGTFAVIPLGFILPCFLLMESRRRQDGTEIMSARNAIPNMIVVVGVLVILSSILHAVGLNGPEVETPRQPALIQDASELRNPRR